jgi:alpha-glucosidase
MRKPIAFVSTMILLISWCFTINAQPLNLTSPDGKIEIEINLGDQLSWKVSLNKIIAIENAVIGLDMGKGNILGHHPKLKSQLLEPKKEIINVPIPNKDAVIESHFNQLSLTFKGEYQVLFRAYNDGIAYRFIDGNKKSKTVINEEMTLTFPQNTYSFFPQEESMYSHNERKYLVKKVKDISTKDFCSLPVLFDTKDVKVLFTESSLHNYPGLFLAKNVEPNSFSAIFPKYVLKAIPNEKQSPDRNEIIQDAANYIAKVEGGRSYPWRVFVICNDDKVLVESNLVTQLSESSKIKNTNWIKPGKVAWDWYNANNIYGVDFKAGLNMDTYKYYIDFASKNNIEYVILDEGWTKSTTEILDDNEHLDVPKLIQYAKSKNVEIILWVLWKPLNANPDKILKLYSSWGAVGVKVDFMQRSDQYMVKSYEEIAKIAAKYKMLVDYHGAFKPAGIERVYPNLVNYEGVLGNEQNKWSKLITPEHNVTLPFIRMVAGPLDFTPGSMVNANEKNYAISFTRPMSMGTRAHQVAMYIIFEAPLQMMCESPTLYHKEQKTVDFITSIPTTWDETKVLKAAVADYIVLARRKGNDWYIGAMTDWENRNFEIDLSFLDDGKYEMKVFKDGLNVHRNAMDYKIEVKTVTQKSQVKLNLAKGGGFSAIIKKVN